MTSLAAEAFFPLPVRAKLRFARPKSPETPTPHWKDVVAWSNDYPIREWPWEEARVIGRWRVRVA